ncbi:MAG TPA: hypothetical protein VFF27_01035 [Bacteroidia bacterium]|jgi:hypothetical protein|nr:hypothetical protein [Bacteroidia bacterium]
MEGLLFLFVLIYIICHIPAIVLLILGLVRLKSRPENAKKLLIAAGIYFIVGGGICGALLS